MLPAQAKLARQAMLARLRMLASAGTLTQPNSTGPKHAPQLTRARQIRPVARAQRKILMVAGHRSGGMCREPVIWVRPFGGQRWIAACFADALRELGKLVAATLADRRERHRVPR